MTPATGQADARPRAAGLPARTRAHSHAPARAVPATAPPAATGPRDQPGSHVSTDLHPDPRDARKARKLTRDALTRWGLAHLCDAAELISSELATNAIRHARPPHEHRPAIILAIHHRPPLIIITVWDNGPGQPRPAEVGSDAEAGRGLAMVDALTVGHWRWRPTPRSGGKVVTAALTDPAVSGPRNEPQDSP